MSEIGERCEHVLGLENRSGPEAEAPGPPSTMCLNVRPTTVQQAEEARSW
jgi:hypothetical protein